MARLFNERLPVALALATSLGVACGGDGHPPPVGSGGRSVLPPIIIELGGTSNAGTAGSPSAGTGVGVPSGGATVGFAGTSTVGTGGSFAGDSTSFGGTMMVGSDFGGVPAVGPSQGGSGLTPLGFSGSFSGSF